MSTSTSTPPTEKPQEELAPGDEPTTYFQADEKLIGRSIVGSGTPIRPVFWWLRRRKRRA